jgi:hypothetical protein
VLGYDPPVLWLRAICCQGCEQWFVLCSSCDRGQRYCGELCSEEARRVSVQAAGAKYQRTERGRALHAERQRRYRARRQAAAASVTHQGCSDSGEPSAIVERAQEARCTVNAAAIGPIEHATTANNRLYDLRAGLGAARCTRCGCTGVLLRDPRATFNG